MVDRVVHLKHSPGASPEVAEHGVGALIGALPHGGEVILV